MAYIVQFVMSSESIPPSRPKSAPEAPTEILDWIKRDDNMLPPKPEITYSNPILTVGPDQKRSQFQILFSVLKKLQVFSEMFRDNFHHIMHAFGRI